jgi:MFS family permease
MSEATLHPRDKIRCLIALIASLAVVSTTSSLTWPILSEYLRNQGFSETAISINAAAQFAGIVIVALLATRIIPRLGFFRTILMGLALAASMLVLLPFLRDYWIWLVLRFLLGIGNSLLFTAGDTWINQILDDRVRGRWLGVYSTVGMAGWAVGPILGSQLDPASVWPFACGLVAVAIAGVVLMPTRRIDINLSKQDDFDAMGGRLWIVFLAAPTVLLASAMFGVVEGGMQSFAHLYTMDVLGNDFRQTGYAVIWVGSVGAIFFQYPIGWLADKVDRGWLLVACVFVLAAALLAFPYLIQAGRQPWNSPDALMLWTLVAVWGGSMGAIFTVGITLLGERFRNIELIGANAVFSLLFGVGGMVGPLIVGTAMDQAGPAGFPSSLFIAVLIYGLFAAWRQATRGARLARGQGA